MEFDTKRNLQQPLESVQEGNRSWWTTHTMSYDWKDKSGIEPFSLPWFDDIDQRFLHGARLLSPAANPFEELMNIDVLAGKRVLEIGCGMGFHTEMLARAGARLSSIDISDTSIEATRKRLALKGLEAEVAQMDAEGLRFADDTFDLVWSWGVIHHSSSTARAAREIARVLRRSGQAKIMVYNMAGAAAYITILRRHSWAFWRGVPLDETMWRSSDGFTARFYTPDLFADMLRGFFGAVDVRVMGQEADAIPLPGRFRRQARKLFSDESQRKWAATRGSFLFAVAQKA